MNRRRFVSGVGVIGISGLAGCSGDSGDQPDQREGSDDTGESQQEESNDTEGSIEWSASPGPADLSSYGGGSLDDYTLEFETGEPGEYELTLANAFQTVETRVTVDDDLTASLPKDAIPIDPELSIDGTDVGRIETELPDAFRVERRVEGTRASAFESSVAFNVHDLDRDAARRRHLEYVNDRWAHDHTEFTYVEDYDQLIEIVEDSEAGFEQRLEAAAELSREIEISDSMGAAQSGYEIGHTTAEIVRDKIGADLVTMRHRSPDTGNDGVIQFNPETNQVYSQNLSGSINNFSDLPDDYDWAEISKATIFDFRPGEVDIEGVTYHRKSNRTALSLRSMAHQDNLANTNFFMNDYFMDEASDAVITGDIEPVQNLMYAAEELAQLTEQPLLGEDASQNGRIGIWLDEDELLDQATVGYVGDLETSRELYRQVMEEPEPVSRDDIEREAGL